MASMNTREEVFEKLANFGLLQEATSMTPLKSLEKVASSEDPNLSLTERMDLFLKEAGADETGAFTEDSQNIENDNGESQNGTYSLSSMDNITPGAGDSEGGEGLDGGKSDGMSQGGVQENDQGESQNGTNNNPLSGGDSGKEEEKVAHQLGAYAQELKNNIMDTYMLNKEANRVTDFGAASLGKAKAGAKKAGQAISGFGSTMKGHGTNGVTYMRGALATPAGKRTAVGLGMATTMGIGAVGYNAYKNRSVLKTASHFNDILLKTATGITAEEIRRAVPAASKKAPGRLRQGAADGLRNLSTKMKKNPKTATGLMGLGAAAGFAGVGYGAKKTYDHFKKKASYNVPTYFDDILA